jgi:hypothetical protein
VDAARSVWRAKAWAFCQTFSFLKSLTTQSAAGCSIDQHHFDVTRTFLPSLGKLKSSQLYRSKLPASVPWMPVKERKKAGDKVTGLFPYAEK